MKFDKKKHITIVLPVVLSIILVIVGVSMFFGGVKQTKDAFVHELGRNFQLNISDFFDVTEDVAEKMTLDVSGVDANKVGVYEVTATYKLHTYTIRVEVVDTTAPR